MEIERIAVTTLGCRVNQYESEAIAARFSEHGYEVTRNKAEADVIVINTCCVTKTAESKSRRAIHQMHRLNPDALIVVVGCYSQRAGHELLSEEGVGLVCGNGEKENLVALVEEVKGKQKPQLEVCDIMRRHHFPSSEQTVRDNRRLRAYVKIQDGCEQFCTYCIVPYVRGPVVSRAYDDVIAEAKALEASGFRELVLTGIHTGFYGRDLQDGSNLARVLRGILAETGIDRIRLSSIEPIEVTDELLDIFAAEPRVCPHLHIPLQSGDDNVLEAMGRRYNRDDYLALAQRIYSRLPDAAISADIMVGFPGESEGAFLNTLDLAEKVGFAFIHCFPYSPRPGTRAAILPHRVPLALKEERQHRLLALASRLKEDYARRFIGREVEVLVEVKEKGNLLRGHTGNFLQVRFPSTKPQLIGKLVTVRAVGLDGDVLIGEEI